jgi:hypothetical protein
MMNLIVVNRKTQTVLNPLKNLIIFCIVSGLITGSVKAQVPQKISYQTTSKIIFLPVTNLRPHFTWLNIPPFTISTNNYYDLLYPPTLLNSCSTNSLWKLNIMKDYSINRTLNIKWEIMTRKAIVDTTNVFFYPLKNTDGQPLTNSHLYRIASFVIPKMLLFNYPGASETINYPPAYLQPKYPLTEKSK